MSTTVDRAECLASRHGTAAAYQRHGCRCADARLANRHARRRQKTRQVGGNRRDAVGTIRRIRSLQRLGWPMHELAARLGRRRHGSALSSLLSQSTVTRETAQQVDELFEQLCMTPGPSASTARRAAAKAWPPPLAWDDIDHDPAPAEGPTSPHAVNEVVVRRVVDGTRTADTLTRAERLVAVRRLSGRGMSVRATAVQLGMANKQVQRDRSELAAPSRPVAQIVPPATTAELPSPLSTGGK